MAQKTIKEVENFKKELEKSLKENGFEVESEQIEFNGVIGVKDHVGYFFEFYDQDGKDTIHKLDDDSRIPIIRIEISTFIRLPHLTSNQRIALMERLVDYTGIVLKRVEKDNYSLKTSSVFTDALQMFAIVGSAFAYFRDSTCIICDFIKTVKK